MKSRARGAVGGLRATLAAMENAEAVSSPPAESVAIEQVPIGAGATEAARRELSAAEVTRIVRDEMAGRLTAAADYESWGRADRAAQLREEARVLADVLARI